MALIGYGTAVNGVAVKNRGSVKSGSTSTQFASVAIGGVPSVLDGDPNNFRFALTSTTGSMESIGPAVSGSTAFGTPDELIAFTDLTVASRINSKGGLNIATSGKEYIMPGGRNIYGQTVTTGLIYATGWTATIASASGSDLAGTNARSFGGFYEYKLANDVVIKTIAKPTT